MCETKLDKEMFQNVFEKKLNNKGIKFSASNFINYTNLFIEMPWNRPRILKTKFGLSS